MKIKKLFVAITVSVLGILGFTACLGGGSNSFNVPYASPALIDYDLQAGLVLKTYYGPFIPDNASAANLSPLIGSWIYANFDYNSEFQTGQYLVASNIRYAPVKTTSVYGDNPDMIRNYSFPLSSVELFYQSFSLVYKGSFFVITKAKLDTNQELDYYLYTKSDDHPDTNGATNIYLQAYLSGTTGGSKEVEEVRALNMINMVYSSGRDTTINEGGTNYALKYLKLNLKYCSSINENKEPVFQTVNTQPIYFYVLRDDLY